MTKAREDLETRVLKLETEVLALRETIARLRSTTAPPAPPPQAPEVEDASEDLLTWVGKSSLLPRLATISFLLVLALTLRTVTDNGMIGKQVGAFLGMGYAALLIAASWWQYRRGSHLAPVFAACGGVLMFTIVVELQTRFHAISSMPAYLILLLTGAALGGISYCHQVALPVLVGSLGMCLAGVLIDYPNPFYPSLVILLLLANLLGAFATRLQRCSWLRWILLLVTATVVQVWALKLVRGLHRGGKGALAFSPEYFLPLLFLLFAAFLGVAVLAVLRRTSGRISRFDLALPTITAVWAHAAAAPVIYARFGNGLVLGWMGVFVAGVLLGFGVWLARRESAGVNAFAVAGTALGLLTLPAALESLLASLPFAGVFALLLAHWAQQWRNGFLRLLSYLVQIYACGTLLYLLWDAAAAGFVPSALAAGILAATAFWHFRWCRTHPPTEGAVFFSPFDRQDATAIFLLLAALANGFFLPRTTLYHALQLNGGDILAPFHGGQSVLINVTAAVLLWFSLRRRNREIRNVALLLTLIGAGKVFLFDLFSFRGAPLVLAVFSFGLTVSLLSLCLARWTRLAEDPPASAAKPPVTEA